MRAVSVDDQPGQSVGFAEHEPRRLVAGEHAFPVGDRLVQPLTNQAAIDRFPVAKPPKGNLRFARQHGRSQNPPFWIQNPGQTFAAGSLFDHGDARAIDPWMSRTPAALPGSVQADVGQVVGVHGSLRDLVGAGSPLRLQSTGSSTTLGLFCDQASTSARFRLAPNFPANPVGSASYWGRYFTIWGGRCISFVFGS